MTLDISNSAYMLFMTFFILLTLYWVTFWVRILFMLERIIKQATNIKHTWKRF